MVTLPYPSDFRGWTYGGWLLQQQRTHQKAVPFSPVPLPGIEGYQFPGRQTCLL